MNPLNRFFLSLRPPPRAHCGIDIYFDQEEEFVRLVEALDLAARIDPLRYKLIQRHAPRILISTLGAAHFDEGTQSANINLSVLTDPAQIASVLVHEATHGWLHSRGVKGNARHETAAYYQMTRFLRRYLVTSGQPAEVQRAWLKAHDEWVRQALLDSTRQKGRLLYKVRILWHGLKQIADAFRH